MQKLGDYLHNKLKIPRDSIDKLGAFDSFIDEDSLFFVDPLLIKNSNILEFKDSYENFLSHFRDILDLLSASDQKNDLCWRNASKKLAYKEKPAFGLGYTGDGKFGNGIGEKLRDQILETINEILKKGTNNPSLFELIGAFEDGISCDRISDMTCSILYDDFLKYTERILTQANVPLNNTYNSKKHGDIKVLPHPVDKNAYIVLVPKIFLGGLLLSEEIGSVREMSEYSTALKDRLNEELGSDWKKHLSQYDKKDFKKYLATYPEVVKNLLEKYESSKPAPYDLEKDYDGRYRWYEDAFQSMTANPISQKIYEITTQDELCSFIVTMIDHFKDLIENKGLWRNLYRDETPYENPHIEKYAQNLFRASAQFMCNSVNVDLNPEVDGGSGPVDFKISKGADISAIVEIKKSNNSGLTNAVNRQLPMYKVSTNSFVSYMVTIEVNKAPSYTNSLVQHVKDLKDKKEPVPEMIFIDGLPKASASKKNSP